jgi:quercetin dioxygenase-like cupin family protein
MSDTTAPTMVRSAEVEWRPTKVTGVSVRVLRADPASGGSSSLVRFGPGVTFPAHDHPAGEEVFVIEGDVTIGPHRLKPGDYLYTPPNGKHAASSDGGCIFLVTLPKPVVFLQGS